MADHVVAGEAIALTDEDERKRAIVEELLRSQNQRIVDFAKHLVSVSFSAIGVVLALKDKWLRPVASPSQKLWLGIAIALFLATGLLSTLAVSTYVHKASLSDYGDVDAELSRVARRRYGFVRTAFVLAAAATIIVVSMAI